MELSTLIINIITSGIVGGLVAHYVKSRIDLSNKRKLAKITKEIELNAKFRENYLENLNKIIPSLDKVIYQIKNSAIDLANQFPDENSSLREDLGNQCLWLTENLYTSRIYLEQNIFKEIHKFKRLVQTFILVYDDRILIKDKENLSGERSFLEDRAREIEAKNSEISLKLKEELAKLRDSYQLKG